MNLVRFWRNFSETIEIEEGSRWFYAGDPKGFRGFQSPCYARLSLRL